VFNTHAFIVQARSSPVAPNAARGRVPAQAPIRWADVSELSVRTRDAVEEVFEAACIDCPGSAKGWSSEQFSQNLGPVYDLSSTTAAESLALRDRDNVHRWHEMWIKSRPKKASGEFHFVFITCVFFYYFLIIECF
jgi:hypothetical protein